MPIARTSNKTFIAMEFEKYLASTKFPGPLKIILLDVTCD